MGGKGLRYSRWAAAGVVCLWAVGGWCAEIVVPLMATAPRLDGKVDAAEWRVSAGFDGLQYNGVLQRRRVRARVGATLDTLFVALASRLPDEGDLVRSVDRDSLKAVHDDSVEIYVNPTPASPDCVEYQFLVNSLGKGACNIHVLGNGRESPAWKGDWQQAHGFHDGWWHAEFAIPIRSMGTVAVGRTALQGEWRINVTRNWKNPWEWSALGRGYAHGGPVFRFVASGAPAVCFEADGDVSFPPFKGRLVLHNPAAVGIALAAAAELTRNNMPAILREWQGNLPPGGEQTLVVDVPADDPATTYQLDLSVRSGNTTFYARNTSWKRSPEPYRWSIGPTAERPPIDIRLAHYPYLGRLRLLVDVRGLPAEARLDAVTGTLRSRLESRDITALRIPAEEFADGFAERDIEIDLPHGDYEIAVKASGEGVPAGETVRRFERHVFPWERLPVGRSTTVHPPFEPLALEGNVLRSVLREHRLSGLGLPAQVVCTSANTGIAKPILAAPIRFAVTMPGEAAAVRERALEVIHAAAHEVRMRGGFDAGGLAGTTEVLWDYDGTARVDLTLRCDTPVHGLVLEIPFRAEAAGLLHANSDRIRAPIAQAIPGGEGGVWDATTVACDDFLPNFCPYVYVGDAVRGLCWFAENDAGWGWDPATPNMVLERRPDAVVLRIPLINRPTDCRQARTITFGILAAPVKPRLVPPGMAPGAWRYRYLRERYSLLGTDINWFSLGTCGSFYPAGGNLWFWEMLARGNREQLNNEAVESVVQRGREYFEPYGPGKVESYERHVRHNLRSRYGTTMVFYYNRASHQGCEEFETFKDEWCLTDLRSVEKGNGLGEIKVVPSDSYIDFNLYWYARSFEIGANRGVYWDNWFIAPSFNTRMTAAYRREDGSVVPAAGIWALRELAKRTFVMMNERGMLPITFPHMTSFNPLPMMSFATVQYDWEWKYSRGDVHDRHTREYILLASTGDLAGVWPVPLGDHGALASDPWTQRTFTGVRLVHELDGYGGFGTSWDKAHQANAPLFEPIRQLLDEERLVVYRYWEQDDRPQPLRTDHADVPAILYSVPGQEAVAAVTNYTREPLAVTLHVDPEILGFRPGTVAVANTEDGTLLTGAGNDLRLELPGHDVRVLRITGEKLP
ncbi:MAG: hypothetical protein JXR77_15260 [Lentisphaeria bacterium]|nr:hypothetical protein [Lentisphaeria bacterium]